MIERWVWRFFSNHRASALTTGVFLTEVDGFEFLSSLSPLIMNPVTYLHNGD